jgi:hypothetical protein
MEKNKKTDVAAASSANVDLVQEKAQAAFNLVMYIFFILFYYVYNKR